MTTSARPPGNVPTQQPATIPEEEWDLPVSFNDNGQPVSLRDYVSGTPAVPIGSLTPEQRADLTVMRLERRSSYEMAMIGVGLLDKERALTEVRARSQVGRVVTDIEFRMIRQLIDHAPQVSRR
jgi:hypothetical protein